MDFSHLASLDKLLTNPAIPSSVTGGNQIRDAAALEERGELGAAVEGIDKFNHLHQS